MDSFLHHNNKREFLDVARSISNSKLIEKMNNNKKGIRVHLKTKSGLVYNQLNPSKEKTKQIMNNYFKSTKTQRKIEIFDSNKELNKYFNDNNTLNNQNKENILFVRTNIRLKKEIKQNNNEIDISNKENYPSNNGEKNNNFINIEDNSNKNNNYFNRSISLKSEKNKKVYYRNKGIRILDSDPNSFISEKNINQENKSINKLVSPICSYKNSVKPKVLIRNTLIPKNCFVSTEEIIIHDNVNKTVNITESNNKPLSFRMNGYYNNNLTDTYKTINLSNPNINETDNNKTKVNTVIKIEDLIFLEEKLNNILKSFDDIEELQKFCVEWWTFYNYSSFYNIFDNVFLKKKEEKNISHEYSVLEFLSIIVIYEVTKDVNINQSTINCLNKLMSIVYQNFLIICDFFVSIIPYFVQDTLWVKKLQIIINNNKEQEISNNHFILLKNGCNSISILIKNILKLYNSNSYVNGNELIFFLRRSSRILINTLNIYFKRKLNIELDKKENAQNKIEKETPYFSSKNTKQFTLVLDLDETIICRKTDSKGHIMIMPRPGLKQFLKEISKIYEIIVFTSATQTYADPILNSLDIKNQYFDKRLYRQHTVLINDVYIKDLSKLGRDLSKVVILDNKPQNYELQKENGIYIKSYYGNNQNDKVLCYLIPILNKIANNPQNDVRKEIKKYHEEIYTKITTNLS